MASGPVVEKVIELYKKRNPSIAFGPVAKKVTKSYAKRFMASGPVAEKELRD
ncbi:hypothetical protein VTL71DRAFT_14451 [Oculimacula yallundae]|uniref:Uncharacterized protein n=1 Tax=Oculimacula yallundae TaxID=86028 RepID=A0ABR4CIH5_9HELO